MLVAFAKAKNMLDHQSLLDIHYDKAIGLIVKLLSTFHAKGSFINTSGQQVLVDDSLLSKRGSAE